MRAVIGRTRIKATVKYIAMVFIDEDENDDDEKPGEEKQHSKCYIHITRSANESTYRTDTNTIWSCVEQSSNSASVGCIARLEIPFQINFRDYEKCVGISFPVIVLYDRHKCKTCIKRAPTNPYGTMELQEYFEDQAGDMDDGVDDVINDGIDANEMDEEDTN